VDESLPIVVGETDYAEVLIMCAECRDELQELKRRNRASLSSESSKMTAALWPSSFLSLRQGGWMVNSVLTRS